MVFKQAQVHLHLYKCLSNDVKEYGFQTNPVHNQTDF